jgi:hypothetical protein
LNQDGRLLGAAGSVRLVSLAVFHGPLVARQALQVQTGEPAEAGRFPALSRSAEQGSPAPPIRYGQPGPLASKRSHHHHVDGRWPEWIWI